MSENKPQYPVLLHPNGGRWGINYSSFSVPIPNEPKQNSKEADAIALHDMLEYGAESFYANKCDLVAIDCMPWEAPLIDEYMANNHPTVKYAFGYGDSVVSACRDKWRDKYGNPTEDDLKFVRALSRA